MGNDRDRAIFKQCMDWIERFPSYVDYSLRGMLRRALCAAFHTTELELIKFFEGSLNASEDAEEDSDLLLESILPKDGWFSNYAEYTRYNESPMAYHIFTSLSVLGACLGRRVWKSMGGTVKPIYPNYCNILIGGTGMKKTTAADRGRDLIYEKCLCPIMADKITPESLVSTLSKHGGQQFVYAPEGAVFFGKQRYNDGLATIMLRLLDCPESFEVETQSRQKEHVSDVALTVIIATTVENIVSAAATELASSGFLNRFVIVMEEGSNRCFPNPYSGDGLPNILADIDRMKTYNGEMDWTTRGNEAWTEWYIKRWRYLRKEADDLTAEVLQRSFNHVIRTAMLMHLVLHDNYAICDSCVEHAIRLIEYTDRNVPRFMSKLKNTRSTADLDFVLQHIVKKGAIDRSALVKAVSRRMLATQLNTHIKTLEEAGRIRTGVRGALTYYVAIKDGTEVVDGAA